MLTLFLEQMVKTLGIKPTAYSPRKLLKYIFRNPFRYRISASQSVSPVGRPTGKDRSTSGVQAQASSPSAAPLPAIVPLAIVSCPASRARC